VITQQLPGTCRYERRSQIDLRRYPTSGSRTFTAAAAADGAFSDADVVCLFGIGHDPTAAWWMPVLDAHLADRGVRLLKVGADGDIPQRGISVDRYRRLDGVLCQTPVIAAEAQEVGLAGHACYPVRNGLSLAQWVADLPDIAEARHQLAVRPDAFVVVGLGRFTQRKRFADLVSAFTAMAAKETGESARPVLLLHGSDFGQSDGVEAALRSQVESVGVWADVRFVTPDVDPRVTLAAADAMACLSEREGAPNVFIEAFASGCPVVASDLPGHRVYADDGIHGRIVPVGDIRAASAAFDSLWRDRAGRLRMAEAARGAATNFDIAQTSIDYLRAFADARAHR
jgi:glycosyltransferase involved in cell wall biosynthesis